MGNTEKQGKEKKLNHLSIIPDGNSRWAIANNVSVTTGYKKGFDRIVELSKSSRDLGIHTLTLWGLSTENWLYRPKKELDFIFGLFIDYVNKFIEDAQKDGVRVIHLGRKDRLPKKLMNKILEAQEQTKDNTNYVLNLALDYGGADEIVRATKKVAEDIKNGTLAVEDVDSVIGDPNAKLKEYLLYNYLDTAGQPYPFVDYVVRTSGEMRLSGLLPLQTAYAEFYFEKCFFPDFDTEKLSAAIDQYFKRDRRLGGGH